MIQPPEFAHALYGIGRILRRDDAAWEHFNGTLEGFWRSFTAMALTAPVYLIQMLLFYFVRPEKPVLAAFLVVEGVAFVITWVLWPNVMVGAAALLDRREKLFVYLTAYNWFKLFEIVALTPVIALMALGLAPSPVIMALALIVQLYFLLAEWFIARKGLGVNGLAAAVLVLVDMQFTVLIGLTGDKIISG